MKPPTAAGCPAPLGLTVIPPPLPDVLMLLMTDVLVFLQEKDQKYIFPALVRHLFSSLSPSPPTASPPTALSQQNSSIVSQPALGEEAAGAVSAECVQTLLM